MSILYPRIARRPCSVCRAYLFDDGPNGTGEIVERERGKPEPRGRIPVPCDQPEVGCPKGHYTRPKSLTAQNYQAYRFHQMHRAAGQPLPDDETMMINAAIIDNAERQCRDVQRQELVGLIRVAGIRGARHG